MEKDFLAVYVVEIWKKRLLILLSGIACAVLMIIFCKFIAKESFQATAQVYIRQKPNYTNAEREQVNPITYEDLLKSPALINDVREQYCKATKKTAPMLELFIKEFKVKTTMVEDTTVRKKVSPVIVLSVSGDKRENAKLLMELWTTLFIKHYGDIVAKDALYVAEYFEIKIKEVEEKLQKKQTEFFDLKWQLPLKVKQLADAEDQLAPGRAFYPITKSDPKILGPYNYQDVNVQVQPPSSFEQVSSVAKTGLREQLRQHEIKIQSAKAKGENIKNYMAEKDSLESAIKDAEEEVKNLQKEVSQLEQKYNTIGREIEILEQQFKLASAMYSQTGLEAGALKKDNKSTLEGSDAIVISPAVMPDKRVFPRFTLFTLASFVLGMMLCAVLLIIRKYIEDAEKFSV